MKWDHAEVCPWENVELRKDTDDIDVDDDDGVSLVKSNSATVEKPDG